jgi:hypothetical protein
LVQISLRSTIFTPPSLSINGLQLNHTRSLPPSYLELQNDRASTVLPVIQRKYSNIADTFWISLVYSIFYDKVRGHLSLLWSCKEFLSWNFFL